jgi:alkylation response protein AidB-like acyl-CoA dehydrogenase
VNFGLSEEQRLLDDSVRRFLAERLPLARVRELREREQAFDAAAWQELAALGVVGCLIGEAHGGAGLGAFDAAVIATALGHGAAPLPFLGGAVLAPVLLEALGSPEQQKDWLPRIATGRARVAVAAGERVERRHDAGVRCEGGQLSGIALFVPDAAGADAILVPTRDDLWLVAAEAKGLEVVALPTIDATRPLSELRFAGVAAVERVGPAGGAGPALARAIDIARVVLAADLLGCCDRALELAVAYAQQRRQFDRPIASFQAIRHKAVDMLHRLELSRVGTHYAAWTSDVDDPAREQAAAMAKGFVAEAAVFVSAEDIQVHGGVGFTWDCDAHFYYKRAKQNDVMLGYQGFQRQRLADLVLDPA